LSNHPAAGASRFTAGLPDGKIVSYASLADIQEPALVKLLADSPYWRSSVFRIAGFPENPPFFAPFD